MTDLVDRLRNGPTTSDLYAAAAEIERLRTALRGAATVVRASADEIERLRAIITSPGNRTLDEP